MHKYKIFVLLLASFFMMACNNEDEANDKISTVILTVDSYTDEMLSAGEEHQYLRVKEENTDHWVNLESILGFNYEIGYKYLLKVEKVRLDNPQQTNSKVEYKLVEILSKKFEGFRISFRYAIDADDAGAVVSFLKKEEEELSGSFYLLYRGKISGIENSVLELVDDADRRVYRYGIEMRTYDKIDSKYTRLLPQGQIYWIGDWILHETVDDTGKEEYFVILERVSGYAARSDQPVYLRTWLYKDKTEQYQQLCPNAGVRSVIVAQVLCRE